MTTKREWLVSKGLATKGTRGRFSLTALDAIKQAEKDGMVFSDNKYKPVKNIKPNYSNTRKFLPEEEFVEPPVRDLGEELVGYTRGGFVFAFSTCRACGKGINYCKCSHILAPAIMESLPEDSPAIIVRKK